MHFSKHDGAHEIVHNRKFVPGNRFSGPKSEFGSEQLAAAWPRANHGHATGPNRPRPIGIAWPRPLDSGRSICSIDSNHPIRIKIPDLDQGKVPSPCQRLRIRLLNLTPGLTFRSARLTCSFGSLTEHGPLGPTLPSRIFRPDHAAWTESPSLAESNRLPGRAEPPSLHQKPGSNRLTLDYSTWAIHAAHSSNLPASIFA